MKKVVVGLSGGVDSSVTAYILQQQGFEVIGMYMRNWHDESVTISNDCPWIEDSNDALLIAQQLGIPFQVIDLSEEYKNRIVNYMFKEYEKGKTPNPDILCNREIKFDVFLKAALELGADYVATGHYARKSTSSDGIHHLLTGIDKGKDQSYFLCQLSQDQLSKAIFPLGELEKSEVRAIATKLNLVTANKKDSQGLCFVGKISLPEFLQQSLKIKEGKVLEVSDKLEIFHAYNKLQPILENVHALSEPFAFEADYGKEVATHIGAHYYTIGQRKGLHIGGRPLPSFVIETNTEENIVYSGQGDDHPGLNKWALRMDEKVMHWINPLKEIKLGEIRKLNAKIRYRQAMQACTCFRKNGFIYLLFEKKQRGITPGQFAALHDGDELIGSGEIL